MLNPIYSMHNRKTKDIIKAISKKGFAFVKSTHHEIYYFFYKGVKQDISTYFSHSKSDYDVELQSQIKKQLLFKNTKDFDNFLDCPFTEQNYIDMLLELGEIE